MDHPSDDLLSAYALDPILVTERGLLEAHLAECAECPTRLADIRAFDAQLADEDAWPTSPAPDLQAIDDQIAREDIEAEQLLGNLLEGTAEAFVWANLAEKPKYYTGGVVRKLSAASEKVRTSMPLHALNLADAAIAIAGMLSRAVYPDTLLASWRGTAWKQRANALRILGRFPAAAEALDHAEREYRQLPRPELDLAAVTFIRATIFCEQEEYGPAERLAEQSTHAFVHLGQSEMYCRSRLLEGRVAFELRNLDTAEAIFRQLYTHGEDTNNKQWLAAASLALGNCFIERQALNEATQQLHTGMLLFRELGITDAEIHCRWGVARVVQKSGRLRIAVDRLQAVRDEFLHLGAATDAALVTLDLMEAFLALRKPREVRRAAGNVVEIFTEAGILTGALAAANWLRHAAAMKAVTPTLLEYLRRYFRRVDLQPDFAFVPPSV